jgi:NTP pyrophosphatase (non-canonical NTP hydrolase)
MSNIKTNNKLTREQIDAIASLLPSNRRNYKFKNQKYRKMGRESMDIYPYLKSKNFKLKQTTMENFIGKKVYGFKFESVRNVAYAPEMDKYIGKIGTIETYSKGDFYRVNFGEISWMYPEELIENYLVRNQQNFDENIDNVIMWASSRGLISHENVKMQMLKVVEEVGETASAVLKGDRDATVDGIGDSFVTLIILARQLGLDPSYCLDRAWNEIKDRKGKTVDGIFIKK